MTPQEIQWEQYNLHINNRCRRQYQCHHLEMTHYTSLTHGDHKDNHKDNHQPILDQSCLWQATHLSLVVILPTDSCLGPTEDDHPQASVSPRLRTEPDVHQSVHKHLHKGMVLKTYADESAKMMSFPVRTHHKTVHV